MRVLSIDDSRSVHAFMTICFKNSGHELEHAYDGIEGLKKIEQQEYDLVLLDWEMPHMMGPDVLAEIIKKRPAQKVIMVTTKNNPEDIEKVLKIGAIDYVMKPFTKDIILGKLELL